MRATASTNLFAALPAPGRDRLLDLAREVFFPAGTRIFEEGDQADRFWVIHTGSVILDTRVPGNPAAPVEILSPGDLLGCSWLFPPYTWHLGAEAQSDVRAHQFDATTVRALSRADLEFGEALARRVAQIIAHRMQSARMRLLDLYGPRGGSPVP
ncbi:Crp/Fnr family transcriptional regulator [Actinacidiphila bryophytorum]|uniref:Cyclic nucleotide-binding domain-containing protein n=1 Tax=Actinacidiphila bryophytorum TaxID=1436133 RepID=A0A9W4GYJ1_9ACTN|nr:cyclic nucleotide-binding domain-containing protein [Actinacidiphila bryophytorum]MBM9438406.1 cyclic nucleotide-binding domain-containing protein [Actinacidiphila bryophytorum]MBN6542320.1 cyclic nucleotide-binding domain-containing protein [Actinacidiphila bryophytorum]CAG7613944.1 Cyclic nucleotide-binding domain-containing protein [Actinacidiphila bryophytorum]